MVCLIIGKVVEGNSVKSYVVMNENGSTQLVKRVSIFKFCRDNDVLNVTVSKNSLTGKGVMLSNIPKYKDTGIFGMQQVGGMSQEEVMQLAQPYIEQYRQNKQRKQSKQNNSNDKSKQEQYVMSKIDIIELLINCALQMKNITNEMASNGDFTRYIKQIDIDNAEGDSLDNLIKRQGVNGLAKGLLDRLNRLKNRVKKFGLNKNLLVMIEHLEKECEQLKKLHSETKQIIKQNKDKESIEEKENRQLESDAESENIDDIPVVEDAHIDAIEIDTSDKYIQSIDDIFGDIPVVDDAADDGVLVTVENDSIPIVDDVSNDSVPVTPEKEANSIEKEAKSIEKEEKLDIKNVIDELFLSHDGYKTQDHSSKNGITAEYRSWDQFGMSIVDILTIIYKGKDNRFMVRAEIPPLFNVKGYNAGIFKFPGDYTVKITRENIDKAKSELQNYISNAVQIYAEADKILDEQYKLHKQLKKEIMRARKNLELEYALYSSQDIISLTQDIDIVDNFIDYIGNGLVARTKSALATWKELCISENIVYAKTIESDLKSLINEAKEIEQREIKRQQERERQIEKEIQQERERQQENRDTETYESDDENNKFEDDTFKEDLNNIIVKGDDTLYDINSIREGDYITPFVYRAEIILSQILAAFSTEMELDTESDFSTQKEIISVDMLDPNDDYDDEDDALGKTALSNEADKCIDEVNDIAKQFIDCIEDINSLSSKSVDSLMSLYNRLEGINVDDSDDYAYNPNSGFTSIYLDFLDELNDIIKSILSSIEECIEKCRETLEKKDTSNNNGIDYTYTTASNDEIREALANLSDI